MHTVYFGFLLSAVLQVTPISEPALLRYSVHQGKDAPSPLSLLNDALQHKGALHRSHRFSERRVTPLRTTASTNHRAPWWEWRTAIPKRLQSSWQNTRPTTTMITPNSVSLPKTLLALHNHTYKNISNNFPPKKRKMRGIRIYCYFVLNPNITIKMGTLTHNTQQKWLMWPMS